MGRYVPKHSKRAEEAKGEKQMGEGEGQHVRETHDRPADSGSAGQTSSPRDAQTAQPGVPAEASRQVPSGGAATVVQETPPGTTEMMSVEEGRDEEIEEPIPASLPKPKHRHSTLRRVVTALVAIGSIIAVLVAAVLVIRGLPGRQGPVPVEVTIPRGLTAQQIGQLLENKEVIPSNFTFKIYAELHGASNSLQPGNYVLRKNMEYKTLVAVLVRGPIKEKLTDVTIPEGFTIRQIAQRVGTGTGMDAMEFAVLAGTKADTFRYEFLQSNPTGSLEGYLFPKTYGIPKSADQRKVIDIMLTQFQKETATLNWSTAARRGLSVHQVVTIASLIEREARVPSERRLISAVIWNRLRRKIALRIDATVQYGLPEWKDRLSYDDLKVDTPYNTYLHAGLPPGPIANPGIASLKAALDPAKVGYLYYVLTDPRGKHTFTNTYSEFLRAKAGSKAR